MNQSDIYNAINEDCPIQTFPVLSTAEVATIIEESRIADIRGYVPDDFKDWAPTTNYALGDIRVPLTRNGYYYIVSAVEGNAQSYTEEPTWPTTLGATVLDQQVTWRCEGVTYWSGAYDVWYAVARGWEKKAAKVAHQTQQTIDGQTFNPHTLRVTFLANARYYRRKRGIRSQAIHTSTAKKYPKETVYR